MTRRFLLLLVILCLLPGLGSSALAAKNAAAELTCPKTAGLGEPFVVRLRLRLAAPAGTARPVASATLRFLGRSAPLELRPTNSTGGGQGWEAVAVLGTDVLGCRPGRQEVSVRLADTGTGKARTLRAAIEIERVKRPVESLTLPPEMVDPPEDAYGRIVRERGLSRAALSRVTPGRLWSLPFAHPVPGEVSSIYGIGRVLNGEPKSPHRGLDLEAATGDPVTAAADGVVALTGDFYYTGNTVYLDHGQGLVTSYFHMSELKVEAGQRVARGEVLGLAGDTGRSTRSHLHFGVSALGRLVDPGPLFLYDAIP